jgi:general L-amino acid transport system permease protein
VFLVGVLNTLLVAVIGIVLATILGFVMGVARLSTNWVIARIATLYVEVMRNLPPLFHILFWYVAVLSALPSPRRSLALDESVFLNVRGLYLPRIVAHPGAEIAGLTFALALVGALLLGWWARRRHIRTGRPFPAFRVGLALVIGLPVLALAATGFPLSIDYPVLRGFNYEGGLRLIPEFVALVAALSIYTGGFIAEIVRAGILAVDRGQTEAAYSLGLKPGQTTRLIVIPQAMRVIIPPLTSQYLNLTKNSSLAVAIGYPDLVAVFAGTSLNQTGQAIEILSITMLFYLALSILTSAAMNLYNRRMALVER